MRLFVAVYPPAAIVDEFAEFVATLAVGRAAADGINARLASAATWHVTLAFLGEVPERRLAKTRAALDAAAMLAGSDGPMSARIAGGGRFGRGRFTVLWAGMHASSGAHREAGVPAEAGVGPRDDVDRRTHARPDPLRGLAATVRRELRRARVPFDDKPFRSHLTLARPGDRLPAEAISADLAALRAYQSPEWIVTELALVRSHLGPKPTYDRLGTWPLGG